MSNLIYMNYDTKVLLHIEVVFYFKLSYLFLLEFNTDQINRNFNIKIWGETADEFIPDRFLDANGKYIGRSSVSNGNFLPFSVGKRDCLGKTLADRELVLFFVAIMNKFEFRKVEASDSSV